ncbi:hypothetical protein HN419_03830 [Candidatus Woesearchaeota archaeon]|jgi:NAD+ kinase|nr:hypothetical protein [Candidatus Woesearchaeota archaeon]MBT3537993.1 hypothetical protein [Candidatus Woesearchaeota archaeon]MBT4697347.1 hypothetical protein [Candidatus Woesearchaeota archaeon]MBT4717068.1 hypothetical protein [Candidatus Woesearchaeota archaeon]MBT7105662.1 hypothetical protein [Candidatus Woesearchaeota archaeon]
MNSALVVYKKSSFELYGNSPDKDVRDFLKSTNSDVKTMRTSADTQRRTLDHVLDVLQRSGVQHRAIYRADLEQVDEDLVIAVGGDGTFLEVSHYVTTTPVLGVNSDPQNSVGFFMSTNREKFEQAWQNIETAKRNELSRLELTLEGKPLQQLALNDVLVAHSNPAATTRYILNTKEYKNSGLLVCTAAGSTGWMYEENGKVMPLESTKLQYVHRGTRNATPQYAEQLQVHSLTRQGTLYVDGNHLEYDFTLGKELIIKSGTPLIALGQLRN